MKTFMSAIALSCALAITASGGDCGRKTTETLAHSSTSEIINAGEVSSIRGKVLMPDGTSAEFMIVELYRNDSAPETKITYALVDEIIKRGRMAALETGASGKFCFKNLKPGKYMLRANISGEGVSLSELTMTNIFVTLAPKNGRGVKRGLKVELEMAV